MSDFGGTPLENLVAPERTALLVVDMQNDFCHEDGALAKGGSSAYRHIQEMAPKLRRLLRWARDASVPIVHIRTHHSPWTNSPAWTRRGMRDSVRLFPGSWGADWYDGFEPREADWSPEHHEYVVTKHRYSGFLDTDLDLVLRSHRIEVIVMAGEATNVCVESTARDGYMKDYSVVFTSDCTAAGSQAEHEAALHNMRTYFGRVVTSDELAAAWRAVGAFSAV